MLKIKPEYLTRRGKREFVVLSVADFDRMKQAIEDAEDLRLLRTATKKNAKAPYYTPEELNALLATPVGRKKKAS